MRRFSPLAVLGVVVSAFAQTGPGGVGNNTSNVLWLSGDKNVVLVGAAVTNWNDRSGNNNNATSPFAATRPTRLVSALNGYPVISFDGVNDELRIPDANALDLQQWEIYFIGAENGPKNNNAWLSKGTNTQPNYALWSPNTDVLQLPIYDIFGMLSSPSTPINTTGAPYALLDYSNTVLFGVFPSRNVYKNGTNIYNDVNLLQLPAVNNNQLYLGNVQGSVGWNLNGKLAEVIMFNTTINTAQRLIINNYLSAKYGLMLSANDVYVQDDPANGNYDHEVAGIGRLSSTSLHTDSRGSAVVRINNATGLGNNEFLIWGHDNGLLGSWGSTDFPPGLQGRWFRVWRVNEVSSAGVPVDVANVDMTFDLTNQGPVTASDLRLLVDANLNGVFADDPVVPITATALGGNLYRFAGVSALVNNRRFTLGTINRNTTPLPIELLSFTATAENSHSVRLNWTTATEQNNALFTVERSTDGITWHEIVRVSGAGNSNSPLHYVDYDPSPLFGLSYYRLRQTDHDGSLTFSDLVVVRLDPGDDALTVFPDPAQDVVHLIFSPALGRGEAHLLNYLGQELIAPVRTVDGRASIVVSTLPSGMYVLVVITERDVFKKHLVVAH
jgi:hypothetical protein